MSRYKVHDPSHPCRLIDGLDIVNSSSATGEQRRRACNHDEFHSAEIISGHSSSPARHFGRGGISVLAKRIAFDSATRLSYLPPFLGKFRLT
jgi:hypothetical protein